MSVDNKRWTIAVVILLAVSLSSFYIGRASVEPAQKPSALVKPDGKSWTREEFSKAVIGKTRQQVIDAIGKPSSTSEAGGTYYWYYEGIKDSLTGNRSSAQIVFDNDIANRINY